MNEAHVLSENLHAKQSLFLVGVDSSVLLRELVEFEIKMPSGFGLDELRHRVERVNVLITRSRKALAFQAWNQALDF